MKNAVRFVFVLFQPTKEERKRAFDIVIDNTKNNRGYGAAANIGIQKALADRADWVVVCNQDIVLSDRCADKLRKNLLASESAILSPLAGKLDQLRWTSSEPKGYKNNFPDYTSGACFAIHRSVVEAIGCFDERYFLYYEEVDYCVRARREGFPVRQIILDCFRHAWAPRLGKGSFLHEYYLARNHLLFVERNAPWKVKLRELLRSPKTVCDHVNRKNFGALHGMKDYLLRKFGEKR